MATNNGGVYTWSKTTNSNASADNTINWSEGQAPSSINDSARAMMTSAAKWRDDISGAILTTGISVAYIVASNQNFVNLSDFAGQVIAFTPHVTNGAGPVTMTVDSWANLPLRTSPGKELPAGTIIQGTPYVAVYNNTDGSLYLQNFYGASPYLIPLGCMIDYVGSAAPNSSFALPYGQALSRTTYATLFSLVGTTYGAGDGTATFNIPDCRGRVVAGADAMGGAAASRLTTGFFGSTATAGAVGGGESQILTASQIPTINFSGSASGNLSGATTGNVDQGITGTSTGGGGFPLNAVTAQAPAAVSVSGTLSASGTSNNTGGAAHSNVQPTIVANKLLRIL